MRLSNNCCVLLHIFHRLSIFKTNDPTALPLRASAVCFLACKWFIISPTIWRLHVYVQDAHKHSASLHCFFFVLAVGHDDEIGALVKILIICWNQFFLSEPMHAEQDRWAHNTGSATLFQYRHLRIVADNVVTIVVTSEAARRFGCRIFWRCESPHGHWTPKQSTKPKSNYLHESSGSADRLTPKPDHWLHIIGQGIILYASCCLSIIYSWKQGSRWTSPTIPSASLVIGSRNLNSWSVSFFHRLARHQLEPSAGYRLHHIKTIGSQ